VRLSLLWWLVAVFAVASAVDVFYPHLVFTVLQVILMVAFALFHGAMRYGWRGIGAFAAICLLVSTLFENMGVGTGVPFGPYHYTDELGPKLFYVPLLISPAYFSVGYMAWALASIIVGDVRRGADALSAFATPLIATFIMVLWDLALDPTAATVEKNWIWERGGGFFGVPLSNYLGWFLTVFVFMQVFALYLRARAAEPEMALPKPYFLQAIAMYTIVALRFVLNYLASKSVAVADPVGVAWRSGDIYETAAIIAIFTMLFAVALATLKVARQS
jgi:uncharacterized membrane protein